MLVDSSIWIDYFDHQQFQRECDYLDTHLANYRPIYFSPTIYLEVLRGIRSDKRYQTIKQSFDTYQLFELSNQKKAAEEDAAMIYRRCQSQGITIRKPNDCMIALIALQFNLPIFHKDRDFSLIAKVYPLKEITLEI